jgi:hypothetical protein
MRHQDLSRMRHQDLSRVLSSEAHVETDRPSRYLGQLCRHFNHKGRHLSHRPQAPTVQPGDASGRAPAPTAGAVTRRKRRNTIGLTAAGALAIAVHLGLGGSALAGSRWTDLAAGIVLAVVLVKVMAVTVIALRCLASRNSGCSKTAASSGSPRTSLHWLGSSARSSASWWRGRRKNPVSDTSMMRSEARVPTPKGERYAKQLCNHAARMTCRAEWTPPEGVIEFPDDMGICRITAEPDHLVLAVEAMDPANVERLQQIVGRDIERFASRDGLKVEWVQNVCGD